MVRRARPETPVRRKPVRRESVRRESVTLLSRLRYVVVRTGRAEARDVASRAHAVHAPGPGGTQGDRDPRRAASRTPRRLSKRRRLQHRRLLRDVQVVHQHDALVRVEEPVAPALEAVVARGVRVVAVQQLDVADFELLVRLANSLAILLLLPVVPVLAEETHSLAVEQVQRAGWRRDRRGRAELELVLTIVQQDIAHLGVLQPADARLSQEVDNVRSIGPVGANHRRFN
mmetsp:Transcript_13779/g.58926  ORF Transcript_13779/g.58926 Transcript_13779/m.58926 type:complete len:230 (+) Transcript_13779:2056-2745(+)